MLNKFGHGSYSSFYGSLAVCAAIDGLSDFDSYNSRTFKIGVLEPLDHLELPKLAYDT